MLTFVSAKLRKAQRSAKFVFLLMTEFPLLNLPVHPLRVRRDSAGGCQVYDRLRGRYVSLTPEEWVRQHFVEYLVQDLGYPVGLIANEVSLKHNGMRRRVDTLVGDRYGRPLMIVEYKAPSVGITQAVFDQICRYNMQLRVRWLVVSNGLQHYCCRIDYDSMTYTFLPDVPCYEDL